MAAQQTRREVFMGAAACAVVLASPARATSAVHIVEIKKLKFQPQHLSVKLGDTIRWVNKDLAPHTATAIQRGWNSNRLKKNESFEIVVTAEMETEYFCIYHPHMKASFQVV
jgi:plastocyanin